MRAKLCCSLLEFRSRAKVPRARSTWLSKLALPFPEGPNMRDSVVLLFLEDFYRARYVGYL